MYSADMLQTRRIRLNLGHLQGSMPGSKRPLGLAYGSCIDAILEAFEEDPCCSLRIVSVIGNMPSIGLGALRAPDGAYEAGAKGQTKSVEGAEFYKGLAERVVALSACVDIFIIAEQGYIGVDAMAPLVQSVGGTLVYYSGLGTSALPQVKFTYAYFVFQGNRELGTSLFSCELYPQVYFGDGRGGHWLFLSDFTLFPS